MSIDQPQKDLKFPINAIWKNKDHDEPVTVTGEMGVKDGKLYYSVLESIIGIPEDELEFIKP